MFIYQKGMGKEQDLKKSRAKRITGNVLNNGHLIQTSRLSIKTKGVLLVLRYPHCLAMDVLELSHVRYLASYTLEFLSPATRAELLVT